MATSQVPEWFVTQFSDMVHVQAQQMQTRLRDKVIVKDVVGEELTYNTLEETEANEITSRFAPKKISDPEQSVRYCKMRHFEHNIMIADYDDLKQLVDPQAEYAMNAARAFYRKVDRLIVEAFTRDVTIGRRTQSTVTAASDGVTTIAAATSGLTYAKAAKIKKTFTNNEVGNDLPEDICLAYTGYQEEDVLNEEKFTSGDYTNRFAQENGEVTRVLGMETVKFGGDVTNPILKKDGSNRECFAFTKRAVVLGLNKDLEISASVRNDLEGDPIQITAKMYMDTMRTEGKLVQKVLCQES